jgi:hypothetical protein
MTETTTSTEKDMADDLRQRYDTINAKADKLAQCVESGVAGPSVAFGCSTLLIEAMGLARDAIERLQQRITISAPPVCVDSVKWSQKPLPSYSIEYGGKGKHTVEDEIPIPVGPIDIREFTCRRV